MDFFDTMNPFSYLSFRENEVSSAIIDFVDEYEYNSIPRAMVDEFLYENNINYASLPQYLKDKLDEVDVY